MSRSISTPLHKGRFTKKDVTACHYVTPTLGFDGMPIFRHYSSEKLSDDVIVEALFRLLSTSKNAEVAETCAASTLLESSCLSSPPE